MKPVNKPMLKATLMILTFSQMATTGLSPALSDIAGQFPDVPTATIQMLMTVPCIFALTLSLLAARLTLRFPKKYLIGLGSLCVCAVAVLGVLFHTSLAMLFLWSVLLGCGMGLISALVLSLISDYFQGGERATLMGLQTSFANIGAMLMTAAGGMLTAIAWQLDYLVYLLALPGLILLIFYIPRQTPQLAPSREAVSDAQPGGGTMLRKPGLWLYAALAVAMLCLFNTGPTNLAMYVAEFAIGDSVVSGWAASAFLLGGTLMGMAFGALDKRLGVFTIPCGYVLLDAGFTVLLSSPTILCLYLGCFLAGMSISLVAPQCIFRASYYASNTQELALSSGIIMAASNVGAFLPPILTAAAQAITGSGSTKYRFLLAIALALGMAAVSSLALLHRRKQEQ